MRKMATLFGVFSLMGKASAQLVVHDPIHTAVNQANWITTELKQAAQYEKQLEQYIAEHTTALKEVQQVENEIVQLERMGDPKVYTANIPGVGAITGLTQIYQQGARDIADWQSFTNPNSFKLTAEQVMGQYGSSLTRFTSQGQGAAQSLVQFSMSDYQVASGAQDSVGKLIATKTSLTQARDAAIADMKSAPDQSQVQKDHALIDSLNGAIAGVDAEIQQAVAAANLQEQKNQAAEKMYRSGVTVQSVNTLNQDVKTEIGLMNNLSEGFGDAPHWTGN